MTRLRKWAIGGSAVAVACLVGIRTAESAADAEQAERDARAAIDTFMTAFNAADNDALQAVMNYPHVFVGANGEMRVTEDRLDTDFDRLRDSEGWHHSTMDSAEAVLVKEDKVHFIITFSRHKADGTTYQTTSGLWIMTKQDGDWGLSLRSY